MQAKSRWVTSEAPPALSAGPHMEKWASGPLGTDVCSPLNSSQSAAQAVVQEPGPLRTTYSHKSFTPGTEGRELCSSAEAQTRKRQEKALRRWC